MKKALSVILSLTFIICLILPVSAFAKTEDIEIVAGEYIFIVAEDYYDDIYVENITTTDSSVAELVQHGYTDDYDYKYCVHGVSPGTAIITYKVNKTLYTLNVTVSEPSAQSITVTAGSYECILSYDEYEDYDDYTASEISDVVSSDTDVARIVKQSNEYVERYSYYVCGVSTGSAVITYKKNKTAYKINVKVVKPTLSSKFQSLSLNTRNNYNYYYDEYDDEYYYPDYYVYYNSLDGLKVTSSNTSVATAKVENYDIDEVIKEEFNYDKDYDYDDNYFYDNHTKNGKLVHYLTLNLKKKGTATITISDKYGSKVQIKLTVKDGKTYDKLKKKSDFEYFYYGESFLEGKTAAGASVKLSISGKTYKAKADSNGKYKIKNIKICKVGTEFKITYTLNGISYSQKGKVKTYSPYMENYFYYRNQTKFHGLVKDVNKGDVIKVTIGKKTYTKKITKNAAKLKYSFKVKKNGNYGSTIKMKIVNKFGQTLTSYSDIIYYSKKVKNGMTKKQVKCVPGWRYPEDTTQSSYGTIWYYSDGSYVIFNTKGRVDYWYIS